eukprot:6212277-Pleurochrysis_carterae.AAC.3
MAISVAFTVIITIAIVLAVAVCKRSGSRLAQAHPIASLVSSLIRVASSAVERAERTRTRLRRVGGVAFRRGGQRERHARQPRRRHHAVHQRHEYVHQPARGAKPRQLRRSNSSALKRGKRHSGGESIGNYRPKFSRRMLDARTTATSKRISLVGQQSGDSYGAEGSNFQCRCRMRLRTIASHRNKGGGRAVGDGQQVREHTELTASSLKARETIEAPSRGSSQAACHCREKGAQPVALNIAANTAQHASGGAGRRARTRFGSKPRVQARREAACGDGGR